MKQTTARKQGDEPASIGQRVRELRQAKGLTQRDLAAAAGIDHTYLCHLEGGKKLQNPTTNRVIALAQALGVDPGELLHR